MDDSPHPGEHATAIRSDAPIALPAATELSSIDRLLIGCIIALVAVAVFLLARATVILLQQDYATFWRGTQASGRPTFVAHSLGLSAVLVITLYTPLDTLIHESAHALGGRLAGFWLESVQVGFVKLTRTNTGLKLGLAGRKWWVGGSTRSYPVVESNLRLRYALFIALGPLADLLAGFLGAVLAHAALSANPPNVTAAAILDIIAVLGLSGFVLNAVPIKVWRAQNDGWFLLQLLIGSRSVERAMVFTALRGYTMRQIPADGRSPTLISRAQALAASRAERHLAAVYAYSLALSFGEIEAAGRQLDQAAATAAPPGPAGALAHEAAYFEARHRGRPDAARAWLQRGHDHQFASFMRPRALAAILLAERHYAEARAHAAEGLVAREAYAHISGRQYREEERQLRAMLDEAERALNAPDDS
jgi:hypothetical protein